MATHALVSIHPSNLPALYSPMAEQAREYARRARSESTLRSYKTDWADFTRWCEAHALRSLPAHLSRAE